MAGLVSPVVPPMGALELEVPRLVAEQLLLLAGVLDPMGPVGGVVKVV